MSDLLATFFDPECMKRYVEVGPPSFEKGYGDLLEMIDVQLSRILPDDGYVFFIDAGGGHKTRYLGIFKDDCRFDCTDPAMLAVAAPHLHHLLAAEAASESLAEPVPPQPHRFVADDALAFHRYRKSW